ncbi:RadC family protein [Papillibacter cinnamivorans]|uniref:DNA repair protein RadC n=1 Tax=Papillibacter cinnamivorans DSM 12816 TaxID=1122930 RepID=A0A1W1Z0U7_9FIRM|nr:DNA repair protein RadC [Papillibacter cinnamivorans DSM 12816]
MAMHDGHRQRMKRRFLGTGMDSFEDHNVLEILLFYSIPQKDTNPLAHELITRFGSLEGVFDAPAEELMKVPGVGENTAALIKLIPQVYRRYMISKTGSGAILNSSEKAGVFLLPRFAAERDEVVYLVCLDAKCKVLSCRLMFRGSVNSAHVSVRKIVEAALTNNSTSVILAHNHPSGIALPSEEDNLTTLRIQAALEAVGIELADHIVVADDDFVSIADNGILGRK